MAPEGAGRIRFPIGEHGLVLAFDVAPSDETLAQIDAELAVFVRV